MSDKSSGNNTKAVLGSDVTIVIVSDAAHVDGGASQVAITSAVGLAESGFRVHFFAAAAPIDARLIDSGVIVTCLNQDTISNPKTRHYTAFTALWNIKAKQAMDKLLSGLERKKTIVHIHTWTKALSSSVILAVKNAGFIIALTLHDYFTACPNGGFYNYQRGVICKKKPLSISCITTDCDSRNYGYKLWRVLRQIVQIKLGGVPKEVKHYISVSRFSDQILHDYLPNFAEIKHIYNPIDFKKTPQADPGLSEAFLFIGRLSPEKGVCLLAAASDLIPVPVTMVGDGPLFEKLRNNSALSMTGWESREKVGQRIDQARCLVLPSLWYETQGLVVLEAAARGIPAIISDACAARDLIVPGETGLLFRSGDISDLASCLRRMQDVHFARQLGSAAYQRYWHSPQTVDCHIEQLQNFYSGLLAGYSVDQWDGRPLPSRC